MIKRKENNLEELKKTISEESKITKELVSLSESLNKTSDSGEENLISSQIESLQNSLIKTNNSIPNLVEKIVLIKPLHPIKKSKEKSKKFSFFKKKTSKKQTIKKIIPAKKLSKKIPLPKISPPSKQLKNSLEEKVKKQPKKKKLKLSEIEKVILRRLKKKEKKIEFKEGLKPSKYVKISNNIFSGLSKSLIKEGLFNNLKKDLAKTNLRFVLQSYVSVLIFTTFLSVLAGIFLFLLFLFFNVSTTLAFSSTINIAARFSKVFWILFAVPLGTFLFMYFYPSMEKKSLGDKINQELPFATIHMAAISGSMLDPTKIFDIMIQTKEYPNIEKEFTKLINEINIYGYDLVSALKRVALGCPSAKLVELFNGLATTITSGGNLSGFFNKRSETLLLEYRLEREKYTKSAETFMDIYISVVIAAPMILMLLLIMMKISGFGIALSTSMITLIMVLGVSIINIVFLTFLRLKQPST